MGTGETEALRVRLAAARQRERERERERDARALAARIAREMRAADRRRETQMLCVLGRAWTALGERHAPFRESGARFLAGYVVRDTDRAALAGSAWELPDPAVPAQPAEDGDRG